MKTQKEKMRNCSSLSIGSRVTGVSIAAVLALALASGQSGALGDVGSQREGTSSQPEPKAEPMSKAGAALEGYFTDARLPSEVQAAHDAFLQGDFKRMAIKIKAALEAYPGDIYIEQNLLDLYESAKALAGDAGIDADFILPVGVSWMGVNAVKKYQLRTGIIEYRYGLSLDLAHGSHLEELTLTREDGTPLIDSIRGIGVVEVTPSTDPTVGSEVWAASDYRPQRNANGLYYFSVRLRGQPTMQGWFLSSRMNATESPVILEPALGQELTTGHPTFRWQNFVSSEFQSYERRKVMVSVVRRDPSAVDNTWMINQEAGITSATVGSTPGEIGASELPPDQYVLQVSYRERTRFGGITLGRASTTSVPFSVR